MAKPFMITLDGETKSVKEWAERYGQPAARIYSRIKDGWEPKRAIMTPVRQAARYEYKGKRYTMLELAGIHGDISEAAMNFRITRAGMSVETAVETPNQRPYSRHPELREEKNPSFCCYPDCDKCPYPDCIK